MTAIASRQRSRMLAALACGVGAALVLPVGVVLGARTILGSEGGSAVDGAGGPMMPVTPAALLATVDGEGDVVAEEITGEGALASQAATVAGAAEREVPAVGDNDDLAAQVAAVAGTGVPAKLRAPKPPTELRAMAEEAAA